MSNGRAVVVMVGPDASMHGGIAAVEKQILSGLSDRIDIRPVASASDGSWFARLAVFGRAIRQLRRELTSTTDVVAHVHFASGGSTIRKLLLSELALQYRRPLILHAHGGGFERYLASLPSLLKRAIKRTLRRTDRLIVLSSHWRNFYVETCGVSPDVVCVLPNAIRVPETVPDRLGRAVVQILYLGRVSRAKGAFDLLQAFESLPPSTRSRARLVIAGDGELAELRDQARGIHPEVRILSWLAEDERDRALQESDILALPSYSEGLPLVVLEAMAAGLAIVATPVGGIPDVLTHGSDSLLIGPGDVQALSASLQELIENEQLRHSIGARARQRSYDYDLRTYLARLENLYRETLEQA